MLTVREWLDSLGLSEYVDSFAENRIDVSVLRDLTDQDLKELGVVLGDRRRMLRAITELFGTPSAAPQFAPSPEPRLREEAERRQVTVMFSDLVGSTALSVRMDPEDLRDVISAYQKCVAETVRQFGGFVARCVGDGVLVYFGYPQAHEDDAERAVRAGLDLIATLSGLQTCAPQQIRVGIATGLVVVGHLIPSGESEERGMVGETPNLAARLQSIAEPNMVVIAESTRRLLGDLFKLEDLGVRNLKGIARPARAWAVLERSSVASRFEALHATGQAALVGREEESELLLRRWSRASKGEGQVVLLSGEAGIGKSRLTAAFMETLTGEPHTRLRCFCSPQRTDSALYPLIGQMERAAGLARDDIVQTKLDKLDLLFQQTLTTLPDRAFLAEMLSVPNDGRYPALDLVPEHRRQRTLEALIVRLKTLACARPVLMILEDAHWADPTSLELFGRIVSEIASHKVLLIITFRLEFEAPWIGQPHVSILTLNRLAPRDVSAMIDHIVGNKSLSTSIRQDIVERTDGIPLFVEEMTKAVLEAESEGEARRTAALLPSSAVAVPASLHASLMARLDRLGPAKELAQIGAAIGREFSHALLAAVAREPEPALRSALDCLVRAGLLFRQGTPPQATYLFKHALVQDAAYSMLLREPRRTLHARIAEALETQFAEIAENHPELLARHCTEAGQIEKAVWLWGKAGERSAHRSALVEAVEQLARALDLIATLPSTPGRRREEIKLQVALISPLLPVKGYAAPETKAAVDRARLLIEQAEALGEPPDDLLLFSVLYGVWVRNYVAFNGDAVRELATEFLKVAGRQRAIAPLMVGHRIMGLSLLATGDLVGSRTQFDQAIGLYDPADHRALAMQFGQDVRVASLSLRSWASCVLGLYDAALADSERALKHAREFNHAATLMYALWVTSISNVICGNYAAATSLIDELLALSDQTGWAFWAPWAAMQRGTVSALTGKGSDAVQTISSGLTAWRSTGSTVTIPFYLSHLARAHAELGQFNEATRCIGEALTALETTNERWCEAEVNRIAGKIALLSPERDAAKAEAYFERALSVAREQQAKSWELRVAISMACLRRDQGLLQPAHDILAPVCSWFRERFITSHVIKAKALLRELM
jgi:class 3 adenylate cyclase/predicted ATPase